MRVRVRSRDERSLMIKVIASWQGKWVASKQLWGTDRVRPKHLTFALSRW